MCFEIGDLMPYRYFLHVKDGDMLAEDLEGVELDGLDAARAQAIAGGREMLAARLLAGQSLSGLDIIICDAEGGTLGRVGFDDLVCLGG
jgi:hypothetical protein